MNQGQLRELTSRLDILIERGEPMKDEMYVALRSYLEEHSSLLRQIIEKLDTHMTATATTPQVTTKSAPAAKLPADAIGPVTVETVETIEPKKGK